MLTRKAAMQQIKELQDQLAVHQHETRKNLRSRVEGLANEVKALKAREEELKAAKDYFSNQAEEARQLNRKLTLLLTDEQKLEAGVL